MRRRDSCEGEGLKPDAYKLLMQCIETGIELGWRRAHKHNDTPDEDAIKLAIENAIQSEICEWFKFNDEENFQ
jgi:hypothetical protein